MGIKTTTSKLQQQLDAQERKLRQKKTSTETSTKAITATKQETTTETQQKAESETKEIPEQAESKMNGTAADEKHVYLQLLEKLTSFLNDVTIQSKSQLEKVEDLYKSKNTSEDGENELANISSQHQVLLEKVTNFLDESMNQFNDQMQVMKVSMKSKGVDGDSIERKAAEVAEIVNNTYRSLITALKEQFEKIDETYKVQDKCREALETITKYVNDIISQLNDEMNNIKEQIKDGGAQAYLMDTKEKGLATVSEVLKAYCKKVSDNMDYLCKTYVLDSKEKGLAAVNDMLKAYCKKVSDNMDYLCHSEESSDVHCFSPTDLFKLIESEDWDMVKLRVEEFPEVATSWITKKRKDGTVRWKLLPLHVVLCIKAPTDVVLPVLNAYPDACLLPDDLGNLPIEIAQNAENVNEEVVKMLLEKTPSEEVKEDEEECLQNPVEEVPKTEEECDTTPPEEVTTEEEECVQNPSEEVTKTEEECSKIPSEEVIKMEEECNPCVDTTTDDVECQINLSEELTPVAEDCESL